MAVVVAAAAVVALYISAVTADTELKKALQTASLTLIFGALLGGFVKLLLDDFDRGRQERAEHAEFLIRILSDLKSVYDRTERAKVLIPAHQSVMTYGNEMRDLIEARTRLLNVIRAIKVQDVSGVEGDWVPLQVHIETMEAYIRRLIDDFQDHYKELSATQSKYEAKIKAYVEKAEKDPLQAGQPPDNKPWEKIKELDSIKDLLNLDEKGMKETNYYKQFVSQLDHASDLLTKQLRRILG
jgi:hypothetical protein